MRRTPREASDRAVTSYVLCAPSGDEKRNHPSHWIRAGSYMTTTSLLFNSRAHQEATASNLYSRSKRCRR